MAFQGCAAIRCIGGGVDQRMQQLSEKPAYLCFHNTACAVQKQQTSQTSHLAGLLIQHRAGSLPSPHQDFPASESIEVFASLDWTSLATEIASQIKNMGCVALVFSQNMISFLTKARLDFVFWQGCQANSPLADRRSRRGRRYFAMRLPASPAHSP